MMKRLRLAVLMLLAGVSSPALAGGDMGSFAIDQTLGKADAPITIIEYASTTCSHCSTLARETMPKVKTEWIDTGKAKLIFRDFPTAPGALSVGASMIAHCSGPMRYFSVLNMFLEQQDKWLRSERPLDTMKKMVAIAGMSGEDVDACLKRNDLQQAIMDRATHANKSLGVESTPTLFVNGKKIEGAVPYAELDKELKAAAR